MQTRHATFLHGATAIPASPSAPRPCLPVAQDARGIWRAADGAARAMSRATLAELRSRVRVQRGLAPLRESMLPIVRALRSSQPAKPESLKSRLAGHITRKAAIEIRRRGGETAIDGVGLHLKDRDRARGIVLVGCDGWRTYSRRFGSRRASLCYLYGRDDNGPWALRVPGTVDSVEAAIAAVEPAEVRRAREAGRSVLRQGDIYAIEMLRAAVGDAALDGTNHRYDAEARRLVHLDRGAQHGDLAIPNGWRGVKFVRQLGLGMGRLVGAKGRDAHD
jgi:hypothetical protein